MNDFERQVFILPGLQPLTFPELQDLPGLPSRGFCDIPSQKMLEELMIPPRPLDIRYLLTEFKVPEYLSESIEKLLKNPRVSWEEIKEVIAITLDDCKSTAEEFLSIQKLYAIVSQRSYSSEKQTIDLASKLLVSRRSNILVQIFKSSDTAFPPGRFAFVQVLCERAGKPHLLMEYLYHLITVYYCIQMTPHPTRPVLNIDANLTISKDILRGGEKLPCLEKYVNLLQRYQFSNTLIGWEFSSFRRSIKRLFEIEVLITQDETGTLTIADLVADEMKPVFSVKNRAIIRKAPLFCRCQYCYRFREISSKDEKANGKVRRCCDDCFQLNHNWEKHLVDKTISLKKLHL